MSTRSTRPPRGRWRALPLSLATLSLASLASAAASDATQPLGLPAALSMAEQRSQALPAQEALATAGRERAIAAGRLPDPTLGLSADSVPIEGPTSFSLDEPMSKLSLSLKQNFTGGAKRRARSVRWEREAGSALVERALQRARLRRDTALAWLDLYYRQRQTELLTRQRAEAVLQIEAAEAAYRARTGAQADVFMARSALARIDDRLAQARDQQDTAATGLARWVGVETTRPLAPAPRIDQTALSLAALQDQPLRHPEIALLAAKVGIANAAAEVAREDKRPDWSLGLTYSKRGPDFADMVSLSVSVPLQWDQRNRQDRELSARLAEVTAQRAQLQERVRERLAETQTWHDSWRSQLGRVGEYERVMVPLAGARTDAALAAYRGGEGDLSDVLAARRAEIETELERLRIERDAARLWARLEYLLPPADEGDQLPPGTHPSGVGEEQPR